MLKDGPFATGRMPVLPFLREAAPAAADVPAKTKSLN
jgi:hypothetical protein